MPLALIVDDHEATASSLAALVRHEGFDAAVARTLGDAQQYLGRHDVDAILLDLNLPDGNGLTLLDSIDSSQDPAVILITGEGSMESAIEALRLGVTDYLTKPIDIPRLKSLLGQAASSHGLGRELRRLADAAEQSGRFGRIIGESAATRRMFGLISRIAPSAAPVLLTGESGTGKEVVARTIHEMSRRRQGPFVAVNCGAITQTLMESELFGHERGAFTGADRVHHGLFERAHRGTLFLDEITEMATSLQVKLLRALEAGVVRRVGSEETVPIDVRILAATNRPPDVAVAEGKLRRDLLYRLKVFQIDLPPLRQRPDDIEPLARHFLEELAGAEGVTKTLPDSVLGLLRKHRWPGNVRELKNVLHGAYVLADRQITAACLPPEIVNGAAAPSPVGDEVRIKVGTRLADAERQVILATLQQLRGNKTRTAQQLGISLKTLYSRLASYKDLEPPS